MIAQLRLALTPGGTCAANGSVTDHGITPRGEVILVPLGFQFSFFFFKNNAPHMRELSYWTHSPVLIVHF